MVADIRCNNNWLVVGPYPSEKYELVSWDDDIPNNYDRNNKINVPIHQPDYIIYPNYNPLYIPIPCMLACSLCMVAICVASV